MRSHFIVRIFCVTPGSKALYIYTEFLEIHMLIASYMIGI